MNLKDRKQRLDKARDFIKGGKTQIPKPLPDPPEKAQPKQEKPKAKKKKHVAYFLEEELIQRIQIQAAKNGERPCHLVARAAEKELNEKKGDE